MLVDVCFIADPVNGGGLWEARYRGKLYTFTNREDMELLLEQFASEED